MQPRGRGRTHEENQQRIQPLSSSPENLAGMQPLQPSPTPSGMQPSGSPRARNNRRIQPLSKKLVDLKPVGNPSGRAVAAVRQIVHDAVPVDDRQVVHDAVPVDDLDPNDPGGDPGQNDHHECGLDLGRGRGRVPSRSRGSRRRRPCSARCPGAAAACRPGSPPIGPWGTQDPHANGPCARNRCIG